MEEKIKRRKENFMKVTSPSGKTDQIDMDDAVSAKESDWVHACIDAAKSDNFYRTFRSEKPLQRVIEGSPRVCGVWNLRRLLKQPLFLKTLPLIQTSDTVGLPLNMIDFTAPPSYEKSYSLSPTTLRYANNASIGALHEKGDPNRNIPIRSWLEIPIWLHLEDNKEYLATAMYAALRGFDLRPFFIKLGIAGEKTVQEAFDTSGWGAWPPPKWRKGSPLIDTGQLRKSVTSAVVTK